MRSEFETHPIQIANLELYLERNGAWSAFSRRSREEIRTRAGGVSEWSGDGVHNGHTMHCAHLNHDRTRPDYDNPQNGVYLTVTEHYEQHKGAIGRARELGLTEEGNNWAVNKLANTPAKRVK